MENTINKIAFLCHPYHRGGVTRWMADAAIVMAERGIEVYFATLEPKKVFYSGKKSETMISLLSEKKPESLKICCKKVGMEFEFGLADYCAKIYQQVIIETVPLGTPIILSDDASVWAAACGLYESYPLVGVLHSDEQHYYDLAVKYQNNISVFVCVSGRVTEKLKKMLPHVKIGQIHNIPCGIKLPKYKEISNNLDAFNISYVGRITEYQKRVTDIVKISKLLISKDISFHLNIVGDGGQDKKNLENLVLNEDLVQNITFLGWQNKINVYGVLRNTDVLLLTSDFEGTPVSMMEGLSLGAGFVGTRVSGIEDYENHPNAKKCFRIFDVGNIESAVSKILEIRDIPKNERQINARKIAETEFDLDKCIDKYIKTLSYINVNYTSSKISGSLYLNVKSRLISWIRNIKVSLSRLVLI